MFGMFGFCLFPIYPLAVCDDLGLPKSSYTANGQIGNKQNPNTSNIIYFGRKKLQVPHKRQPNKSQTEP